jgi:EAL domain-containing protein (putative c-di-GMP-specific phosphodiesterase class I)
MVTKSIDLGHELGMQVTAEGVETLQQLNFLRNSGCDAAQGYFFSRPLARWDLVRWLNEYRARQDLPL